MYVYYSVLTAQCIEQKSRRGKCGGKEKAENRKAWYFFRSPAFSMEAVFKPGRGVKFTRKKPVVGDLPTAGVELLGRFELPTSSLPRMRSAD